MKTLKIVLIIAGLLLLAYGALVPRASAQGPKGVRTVTLKEFIDHPGEVVTAFQKVEQGEELIITVAAGDALPVKLLFDMPFAHLDSQAPTMTFTRDFLLWVTPNGLGISPDGREWAPIQDLKRVKELFGAAEGRLNLGLGATKTDGTYFEVTIEAK